MFKKLGHILLTPDSQPCLMRQISKLHLAAAQHGVRPIPTDIQIIQQATEVPFQAPSPEVPVCIFRSFLTKFFFCFICIRMNLLTSRPMDLTPRQ
jgi:hypothetical protein